MGDGRRARVGGREAPLRGVRRRRGAELGAAHVRRRGSSGAPRFRRYTRELPGVHREVGIEVEKFTSDRGARSVGDMPRTAAAEAAPIVKWVGGKSKLLHDLVSRLPPRFRRYYEPFAGGAALFFRVAPDRAVLNDFNADLIATYRQIAADPDAVIRRLEIHRKLHGDKHYYSTRARWNDPGVSWTTVERAATFIYLNKTCYNGLWRV